MQRFFCREFNSAAAGNFHAYDSYTLDVVFPDDGSQFFTVIAVVQLWAADEGDMVADEFAVEVAVSVSGAVGGDEQIGAFEIRRVSR